jgi:hypothetical protein
MFQLAIAVEEDRFGADVAHGVGGGGEREVRDQHAIARPIRRQSARCRPAVPLESATAVAFALRRRPVRSRTRRPPARGARSNLRRTPAGGRAWSSAADIGR